MKHNHYFKNTVHLNAVDVYRVLATQAQAPLLCVELSGGGYTPQQTAKAMEALGDLLTKGATTINGIHVVIEEEQPTTQQVGEH